MVTPPQWAALALVGGALATVAAVAAPSAPAHTGMEAVCRASADLSSTMALSTVTQQVAIRARAAALADALGARGSRPPGVDQDLAAVGSQVVAVLEDPRGTVGDLAIVVRPVVRACAEG